MTRNFKTQTSASYKLVTTVKDYLQLTKFTLSFTVVFSCVICYLLAPDVIINNSDTFFNIIKLFIAGMLVTGSANAVNQAAEKNTDALMKRTAGRPVASGRMSERHAFIFAGITGFAGVCMMYFCFNFQAALLSVLSLFIYSFIYTPLKKVSAIAVLVGAFPGALPCLIGWVSGFSPGAEINWAAGLVLFAIQFFWQFPHFWAIAWVAHKDYLVAGFKLLPSEKGPNKFTALQAVLYAVIMVPIGMLPYYFNVSGEISLWIVLACNIFIVVQCIRLYIDMDVKAARRVMFSSYIYLPGVFLALLMDKV